MSRVARLVVAALVLGGCGASGRTSGGVARMADAERMKKSLEGKDVAASAPAAFATAEAELRLARDADAAGDALSAELHAEKAVAAYNHAIVLARLARATAEEASARAALARATEDATRFGAQRRAMDREAEDLDKQLKIAREAQLPAPSGPAEPERERARVVAAQALVTHARLLCGAARLVSPDAPGLPDAEATVTDLEKRVGGGTATKGQLPIDAAARVRAACLTSLTRARRAKAPAAAPDPTDALLAELTGSFASAKSATAESLAAARDERGVVVTLRNVWKGDALGEAATAAVSDLGRVAAAHPTFAVQVVLHDAQAPSAAELASAPKRLAAVTSALTSSGATAAKIATVHAGARAPVVDPSDARRRSANARLEIVFVAP